MAGAHAQTVPPSSLLCSGNALLGNQGGGGLSQPILSSLAARRSQFGGVNMLAGLPNLASINGVPNPGLTGIPQSLTGTGNSGLSAGASSLLTGADPEVSELQGAMPVASDSLALSGMNAMGLPTSPLSITSSTLNSMVLHQGNSPLSRLEQQELLHQQQVRSATPPLSTTAQFSQLSQLSQSMQQERALQASQQLTAAQQTVVLSSETPGAQLLGTGASQQGLGLGSGSTQINGLGLGNSIQHVSGGGASTQQTLPAVKVEPQSLGQSLLQQQHLLMPKVEIKTESDLQPKVGQLTLQRPGSSLGVSSELQLQEALQLQRQQTQQHVQAQLSALQQQRLLQGLPQQHLHDSTSLQLQQLQQQQHQQQLQQQQSNLLQSAGVRKQPELEAGVCARRLMQYLYHQRHRPPDNNITFWRNFVGKYFATNAKKRWCVSLYGSGSRPPTGIFAQDVWHCEICGTNPGRGFETTVEVLPRLFKIKFDSGILEELLFVDLPHEYRQSSGHMVLEYGKAIQESVFEQLRVVREGQLRVVFSSELKILSWEFCARSHEELLPRRLIVPQVNQLAHISQKYQNSASQNGATGLSPQEMQTNCHLFVTSARQLAKNLELPTVNDLGYTKRYVRCLQISEVVNSMKDIIDFSRDNNLGPTVSLHKFPRRTDGSTRSMLRNAQLRALQEQHQQQQQQQQQRQQEQQQQQDQLDLHSLLADTNSNPLSGLQQQFDVTNQLEGQHNESLNNGTSAPEADPFSSFMQQNSLAALQSSLQDSLQSPLQNVHQSSVPNTLGSSLRSQHHQLSSSGRVGALSGSVQASPTNSLSSFQNSYPSMSGGGAAGQSSNHYSRGDSLQHNMVGAASLLQQQAQAGHQHANTSNVVHHLLQEMMINQQLNNNVSLHQGLGVSGNTGSVGGNLAVSLGVNSGLGGLNTLSTGGGTRMLGLGSNNLGGVVSNHLGVSNSNIDGLIGNTNSSIGGVGANVALSALGNHSIRGMGGGGLGGLSGLVGNMGNMNVHNGRLNLAAAVAQQQNVQLHDLGHQSLHHDLGGNNMLGGLGVTNSFGGLSFN